MYPENLIWFFVGVILGALFVVTLQTKAQVTVTASVPLTPENCWTTYQLNQKCFDNCIK